jgi:hypothetical protein
MRRLLRLPVPVAAGDAFIPGFVNLSTWLTAIAGAAVVLLAYHLATVGSSGGLAHR